jgi:transposase
VALACPRATPRGLIGRIMVWSVEVRWLIVEASFDHPAWTLEQISRAVVPLQSARRPAQSTVSHILKLFEETGDVAVRGQRGGRPGVPRDHVATVVALVEEAPWLFLDEIGAELAEQNITSPSGRAYDITTLCRLLRAEGFTRKKLRDLTLRREQELMSLYAQLTSSFCAEELLVLDETKRDNRHLKRTHGRARRGQTPLSFSFDVRGASHSVLAVAGVTGILGYDVVEGGYCAENFLSVFKRLLRPLINPRGEPNSVVVLDNAPIHAAVGAELKAFVEGLGGMLIFLPPYCPEFSPIEKMFAQVKAYLRRHQYSPLSDLQRLDDALSQITVSQAIRYFADCGYSLGADARAEAVACAFI